MKNPFKALKNLFTLEDDPRAIAKGFALGSFIGMMPIPGFQMMVSLGIASLFKLNKKAACIAVFNTNLATGAFVFSFNYWLGKKLLGVNPAFSVGDKIDFQFVSIIFKAGSDVFLSMLAGGVLTGLLMASVVYQVLLKILVGRMERVK
ncbi:MAG: DUF2062 domain-containing protein [Bacteroidales bacterium]